MPRALQSGAISFGLVTISVNLFTATSSQNISFHLIHPKCGGRIKQQQICPTCEEVVSRGDLVRGFEFAKDQYVQLRDEDLEALEQESSQSINILAFVPLDTVDPIYFEKTYFLGPGKGADKPYRLLSEAMAKTHRVALATFVMRGKDNLVLVRSAQDGLMLHVMYFADEVRDFGEIGKGSANTTEAELSLAVRLIEELTEKQFDPEQYKDEYRERLLGVIQEKAEGKEITAGPRPRAAEVIDLMDALKASLEKGRKEKAAPAKPRRAENTPVKKAGAARR